MYYILIETAAHKQMYQEVDRGTIQRYCDLDGVTLPDPQESTWLVDANPTPPSWARPDSPDPVVVQSKIISRLDFRNRFTMQEKVTIYTAAKQATEIQIWLDDVSNAEYVDLAAENTITGLQSLTSLGILSESRMNEILNA
jgi:hypothetical protein